LPFGVSSGFPAARYFSTSRPAHERLSLFIGKESFNKNPKIAKNLWILPPHTPQKSGTALAFIKRRQMSLSQSGLPQRYAGG
jgi:hypothetical protein